MANLCFWNGILSKLNNEDLKFAHFNFNQTKRQNKIIYFIEQLKEKNVKTNKIQWQNTLLSKKEINENYSHINDFQIDSINKGYDCSTCDPFLLLLAEIFQLEILHQYCGHDILYKSENPRRRVLFYSNRGHFW